MALNTEGNSTPVDFAQAGALGEKLISEARREADRILADVERERRNKLAEADRQAGNVIEEALGKVDSLVKNAQERHRNSVAKAEEILADAHQKSTAAQEQYLDNVSVAGQIVADADDYLEDVKAQAETATHEIRESAEAYARKTRAEADAYEQTVRADAEAYAEHVKAKAQVSVDEARREANYLLVGSREESDKMLKDAKEEAAKIVNAANVSAHRVTEEAQEKADYLTRSAQLFDQETRQKAIQEADRLVSIAQEEYDLKTAAIKSDIEKGKASLAQFQAYYDDSLARLKDLYLGKIGDVDALSAIRFPDGSSSDQYLDASDNTPAQEESDSIEMVDDFDFNEEDFVIPVVPDEPAAQEESATEVESLDLSGLEEYLDDSSPLGTQEESDTDESTTEEPTHAVPGPVSDSVEVIDLDSLDDDEFFNEDSSETGVSLVDFDDEEGK